jgi:hypothetical protein
MHRPERAVVAARGGAGGSARQPVGNQPQRARGGSGGACLYETMTAAAPQRWEEHVEEDA